MVDQLIGSEKNSKRIAHIESCFGRSGIPLGLKGRVLVGEGVLTKMCRKGPKPRQFFLFNDILVYGKILVQKKMYVKQNIIPLEKVVLEDLTADLNQAGLKNGWLIKTPNRSFAVYAGSETEKEEWIQHIQKCVKSLLKRTGSRPSGEHAAVWVPDTQAKICMHCNTSQFTLLNRRHHCRNCGAVICASCSKHRFLIPSQSPKPVRVCDSCNTKLVKQRLGENNHSSGNSNNHDNSIKEKSSSLKGNRTISSNAASNNTDSIGPSRSNPSVETSANQSKKTTNAAEGHKQNEESSDSDDDIDELEQKVAELLDNEKPTFYNFNFTGEEGKDEQSTTISKQIKA